LGYEIVVHLGDNEIEDQEGETEHSVSVCLV
jgi:hypothetical protein